MLLNKTCSLSEFLHINFIHLNYTKLLSKEYFQITMILLTFEYFGHHVHLNCFTSLLVSGRNDLPQSQPMSGNLDPDVKDVIINFQAYCCVLQDCFPVHPPSRNPVPRKRPATYKYIGLLFTTFSRTWHEPFHTSLLGPPLHSSSWVTKLFHTHCFPWTWQWPWWENGKTLQKLCGNLRQTEC